MGILETHIDRNSPEFQESIRHFQQEIDQLSQRVQQVQLGGGEDAIARHRKRNKLLARERIQLLCDVGLGYGVGDLGGTLRVRRFETDSNQI